MIRKLSIRNYKCLRDVTVDLERFTVLVGPNASGKSSILQALDLLCGTYGVDHPSNMDGEILQSLSRGVTGPIEWSADVEGQWYRYRTHSRKPGRDSRNLPKTEWGGDGRGFSTNPDAGWTKWEFRPKVASPLPQRVLLRLEASKLIQSNPSTLDPTVMAPDGSGLHSALASIALSDPESWQRLQKDLHQIVPSVIRLRHQMKKGMGGAVALLFDMVGADSLTANQVSEGTLLVLGLLAALYASERPTLVLLDDLDRGLHPKAQRELVMLLRSLLETNSDIQIIATTHSPYLLGKMEPNEVRLTHLNDDGSTACAPLTRHPKFETWKDEMSAGEMWSLFGEKWVVEQEVNA